MKEIHHKLQSHAQFYENVLSINQMLQETISDELSKGNINLLSKHFNWISVKWLEEWIQALDYSQVGPIDNTELLCDHRKIDPNAVNRMKLINTQSYRMLREKFGEINPYHLEFTVFDCCDICSSSRYNSLAFLFIVIIYDVNS